MASSKQYFKIYLNEQRKISKFLSIIRIMAQILNMRL